MAQISPWILRVCPSWNEVVPHQEFNDVNRAMETVHASGDYTVLLEDDVDNLIFDPLTIGLTIDGQNKFGIEFTTGNPIATLMDNQKLKFINLTHITGDLVMLRGDAALTFDNCQDVSTHIDLIDGKYSTVSIRNTTIMGNDGCAAIRVYHAEGSIQIDHSRITGGTHSPAVYFNIDSMDRLKIKNSVLLHADHGFPIEKASGTLDVGIRAYDCVGDNILCSHDIDNLVNANNANKMDSLITY